MRNRSRIYDSVVVSWCLFGSMYLFSNSFNIINGLSAESKHGFLVEAGRWASSVLSGTIFVYGILQLRDAT